MEYVIIEQKQEESLYQNEHFLTFRVTCKREDTAVACFCIYSCSFPSLWSTFCFVGLGVEDRAVPGFMLSREKQQQFYGRLSCYTHICYMSSFDLVTSAGFVCHQVQSDILISYWGPKMFHNIFFFFSLYHPNRNKKKTLSLLLIFFCLVMYYKDNDGFFRFVFKCKKEKKKIIWWQLFPF